MEIFLAAVAVVGVLAGIAQVYYARKQVGPKGSGPAAVLVGGVSVELEPEPEPQVRGALPCYYLAISPHKSDSDYGRIAFHIDDYTTHFDENDVKGKWFFVLKGFERGGHLFRAEFPLYNSSVVKTYVAEIPLGDSRYYLLKWEPYTHVLPDFTLHVEIAPVTEEQFRAALRPGLVIPSCSASPQGISAGY